MGVRRPLVAACICLIVVIYIWHNPQGYQKEQIEQVSVEGIGQISEIQLKASGTVWVMTDVALTEKESGQSVAAKQILLYQFTENNRFSDLKIGNIIRVSGTFSTFEQASNPGGFDEASYQKSKGIQGKLFADSVDMIDNRCNRFQQGLHELRQAAMQQLLLVMDEDDAGVMGAMILGEKMYLSAETKEQYQRTGIGHILAISGLHISLLGAGLFGFLRRYVMPMKQAVLVTMVFLVLYGQFTGFPVSTTRAVLMMCCLLFARYTGRTYDALSAMAFSGIFTLAQEPLQLFQCGFLLSYTAISGILLFTPVMDRLNMKNPILKSLVSGASVFAVTLPVMLWFFYEICPYSVVVNIIVLPLLALLIGVGLAGCVLAFFWQDGGGFLLSTAHYILEYYEKVCDVTDALPWSRIVVGRPPLELIFLYYAVLCAAVICYLYFQKIVYLCGGLAVMGLVFVFFSPRIDFMYTQLDVGQGDCACILYGEHTILIDGGSSSEKEIGKYTIQKFLKYYGRDRVDAVFITHSDSDHTSGIQELATNQTQWGICLGKVFLPRLQNQDEEYQKLVAVLSQYGISVQTMAKGEQISIQKLRLSCVHPAPDYSWESENDYSLCLDVAYENIRILMTGDLEASGEEAVELPHRGYDVLKVGHHGSKTSSTEDFLEKVAPRHAIISAGKNNRYGHPAPVTLEHLEACGATIWNTMAEGAVIVTANAGGQAMIQGYGG